MKLASHKGTGSSPAILLIHLSVNGSGKTAGISGSWLQPGSVFAVVTHWMEELSFTVSDFPSFSVTLSF